jgi:hypothetical protein
MYKTTVGRGSGLGLDWSSIINTGLETAGSIWGTSPYPSGQASIPGTTGTTAYQDTSFDWESLLSMGALLVGGYLLLKTVTKKMR